MIWNELASKSKPIFALAPMNDVTDQVFRQIIAKCASPDVFFTEFVSVESLASPGRDAMTNKLNFTDKEKPLIVQIWGLNPQNYEAQSRKLSNAGYAGIDINMGCPVSKIIVKGACSALINNREHAKAIIESTKNGVDGAIPVSVKTRIGFDEIDLTWIEFLLRQDLAALTVHCRTAKELSKVPNHFEVLPEIIKMRDDIAPSTTIIANGDITTRSKGEELAEKYNLDGIMIGRGVFSDPYVFSDESPWNQMHPIEKISLYEDHINLFTSTYSGSKNPDILKRFAKVYISGFPGAPEIRDNIMTQRNIDNVKHYLTELKGDVLV